MALAFDTAFCRLVGVPLPIVQAPIGGLATPEVASAASEAGALGMLATTWKEPDEIDAILGRMAELTDRPFGVNLILRTPQEERLRRCLDGGVRIVSFFWGDPAPLVPIAHAAGALPEA
jgi:nitronate monooxygenase